MVNSLKLHFVLEGYEEEMLFEIIKKVGVKEGFDFSYVNAKSANNVAAYFNNAYTSDNYDYVYCVYDVDFAFDDEKKEYQKTREELKRILGNEKLVNMVSICTNPNILLVILLGFDSIKNIKTIHSSKNENTDIIKKYIPKIGNKKNYDASSWQLKLIKNQYLYGNNIYQNLLNNLKELNKDYTNNKAASNIFPVLEALNCGDIKYFQKIIDKFNSINLED